MAIFKSLIVFVLAGVCEIGGGYLIWLWLRGNKPLWFGIAGAVILIAYGIVATWQPANFARTYATYGGIFIALSLIWAAIFDGFRPDKFDVIGACIAVIGVLIICYAPRD